MEHIGEGLALIAIGVVVVVVILVAIILCVELILLVDRRLRERAKARKAMAIEEDPSRLQSEMVAAIGMALHQYFQEVFSQAAATSSSERSSDWPSSGRLEIMAQQQRIIGRSR